MAGFLPVLLMKREKKSETAREVARGSESKQKSELDKERCTQLYNKAMAQNTMLKNVYVFRIM